MPPQSPAATPIFSPMAREPKALTRHMLFTSGSHQSDHFVSSKKVWRHVSGLEMA